jgi:hypothetical protein
MQGGLSAVIVVLGAINVGCGAVVPGAAAPDEGLPLIVPPPSAPPAAERPRDEPEPTPPAPGELTGPCPLEWTPHEMHGSVFTLTVELTGRFMAPLVRALCACTRPGQSISLVAHVVPEHGEVTAQTADRPDQDARASRTIDACLARELGARRFEPFRVGSDDVRDCPPAPPVVRAARQPAHLQAPRRVGCEPEEEKTTSITYPLYVDRRDERSSLPDQRQTVFVPW